MVIDHRLKLSPHFTLGEMVRTSHRLIDNTPSEDIIKNLMELCTEFLEPTRRIFGPLWVTSGYRCEDLNRVIGGSSSSAHMDGRAADFVPLHGYRTRDIVRWVVDGSLDFDQIIDEHSATGSNWIHLGMARIGGRRGPRRQALTMRRGKYSPFEGGS